MPSLPSDLDTRCFSLFLRCDEFGSAKILRAMFTTTDLQPFADRLPEGPADKKTFVTVVKSFLLEIRLDDGRVLLLPFLDTLRGRYPEEQDLHGELNDLYQRVLAHLQSGTRAPDDRPDTSHTSSPKGATAGPTPPNPFVPWRGRLADDALFCGRERELRELTGLVASRQSISLLGERRVGKSSLLYQLLGRARKLNPAPLFIYLDMQEVENEADFYHLMLKKLGDAGDTWRAFRDAIDGQYILLALDEFEKAHKEECFSLQLRGGLRALAQNGLTLAIATRRPLDRLCADSDGTSPLHNLCQPYPLSPLNETEARGLITTYLAPTGVRFGEDEIAEALELSGGHPGRLQQIGLHLYQARCCPGYDWRAAYRADQQE